MGSLTNQYVSQSYQGLVKFENSTGVTGTLQYLEDGLGNDLPLQISNTEVKVTGSLYISNVQSNTGLTQALVVDTSTGQIFRNTITGGGGGSGSSGTSGTSGTSGASGSSGTSGSSGVSGSSGTSGTSGQAGTSGTSGSSGVSGSSGTSGVSGSSGTSGVSGSSGTSGVSGSSGTSGTSGQAGSSGTSGVSGSSGTSGTSGISPSITVGDGVTTVNNVDNISFSGATVTDLGSGDIRVTITGGGGSGSSGTSGTSGVNGSSGTSGTSGVDGSSGTSGTSGVSGSSGTSGSSGLSNSFFNYQAKDTITSGDPLSGHIIWNNAVQSGATSISISDTDQLGNNVDVFLSTLPSGSTITLQDQSNHLNFQKWVIGTGVDNSTYWTFPVTLISSTYVFPNNHQMLFIIVTTPSGTSGSSGTSGTSGANGSSGTSGLDGSSGSSGTSGTSGDSGSSGSSGTSGASPFAQTGSYFNTTNNIGITGSLDVSGSVSLTNALKLYSSASYATTAVQPGAYVTESAPVSQSNVYFSNAIIGVFGQQVLGANQTGSIVVSGSNNIFIGGANRANTLVTQGTYGFVGGNSNIIQTIPTITTSSVAIPITNGNTLQNTLALGFTSSSLAAPNISNNNINAVVTLNHQSGSLAFTNNVVLGAVTSTQQVTPGKAQPTVGPNLFIGTTTLNHISSSIAGANNIFGGLTVTNQVSSSAGAGGNGINMTNNIVNGSSNGWWVSGSASTNQARTLASNLIVGANNAVTASQVGSNNGHLVASAVVGQNLIISGSHSSTVGGTAFFGRYNGINNGLDDSQNIVFAVGTGTGTSNRRTGFWIDSGSLTFVSGGLFVTGNVNVSQAVTASSFTGSFVGDGSGLTGISGGNRNGLITTGSIGSTQTIAGKLQISGSGTEPLEILTAPNQLQINILSGGPAFYRNSNDYNTVIGNAAGVQNGFATGSEKNLLFTGFFMAFSSGSNNTVLSGVGSANFRSGSSNTIVGQIGNLEFGNANTYLGSANNPTLESDTLRIGAGNAEILVKSGSNALQVYSSVQITGSINVSNNASVTGSLRVGSDVSISGSLTQSGSVYITGSVQGEVKSLSITSNTASLDLNTGNFFTLQLVSGSATHINPTNIKPGQTINILLNTTGSGTVTFPSSVKQVSGSAYVPTTTTSKDVITLVSFDSSNLYLANVKNLV